MQRYSKQRELILANLCGRYDHPTAEMVYDSVRESIPNISLGTVYRNLKALSKDGLILNFSLDGKEHFDGNTGLHMHLCCPVCGRILDRRVTLSSIEKIVSDCSDVSNIIIYGRCETCR